VSEAGCLHAVSLVRRSFAPRAWKSGPQGSFGVVRPAKAAGVGLLRGLPFSGWAFEVA